MRGRYHYLERNDDQSQSAHTTDLGLFTELVRSWELHSVTWAGGSTMKYVSLVFGLSNSRSGYEMNATNFQVGQP